MSKAEFIRKLLLTTSLTSLILLFLGRFEAMKPFIWFSWLACFLFVILTIVLFNVALSAAQDNNKNTFTTVIIGAVMGKLALSMGVILAYFYGFKPDSKLFIVPFFIIYTGFTIFELHFMMRLSRIDPKKL
jgi:hypothetical protein